MKHGVGIAVLLACAAAGQLCALGTELVVEGLQAPVFLTSVPGDADRLFVVEQRGLVRIIDRQGSGFTLQRAPFLDIRGRIRFGGERGLLGLAFAPDYAASGRLYVNYTNTGGDTVVARFNVDPANAGRALAASEVRLLTVEQPFSNHNGGMLAFGPDGYLYVGMGDGGSRNDPFDAGQRLDTLLGKLLRLDVSGSEARPAPGNPFIATPGARPEIWAFGLRNPWRFSFDRATGDLFIADVGQNQIEEIDFQPAASSGGENYGWRVAEGTACLGGTGDCGLRAEFVEPIHEYRHTAGRSVTGGYVHRGARVAALRGWYLFADFVSARIWALEPLGEGGGGSWRLHDLTADLDPPGTRTIRQISSFGQDAAGEIYVLDHVDGEVFRIIP